MPILSSGTYTAYVPGYDTPLVKANIQPFRFYPVPPVLFAMFVVFYFLLLRRCNRIDSAYPGARWWVFLPGFMGFLGLLSRHPVVVTVAIPLLVLTGTLLAWRWLQVRTWVRASGVAILVAVVLLLFGLSIAGVSGGGDLAPAAMTAPLFALPMIVIRIAIRNGVTRRRLTAGFAISGVLPLLFLMVLCLLGDAPWQFWAVGLAATFAVSCVYAFLFCALVRRNAWAQAVATGSMFKQSEG